MLKFTLFIVVGLLLPGADGMLFRDRARNKAKSKAVEKLTENVDDDGKAKIGGALADLKAVNDEGVANEAAEKAAGQETLCTGEGGELAPSEQGKVDKFLQRFQGKAISKIMIRLIRKQLKDPDSLIRKLLGRAAQDPAEAEFDDGDVETAEPMPSNLLKFVTKVMGETRTVVGYLWKFGFIAKVMNKSPNAADNYNGTIPSCAVTNAIKEFQKFNQITPIDGKLTKETRDLMANDRCGNADVECETEECKAEAAAAGDDHKHLRKKRYILKKKKWQGDLNKKVVMYYYFHNYLSEDAARENGRVVLSKERVRRQVELGLESWTEHAGLNFIETEDPKKADVNIKFGEGDHGDGHPFDGPWGVLAHMFYPTKGDMHFDQAENLTDSQEGPAVNLFYVAAHEIGHGLGLKHSQDRKSLMAPYYSGYRAPMLGEDDIAGIEENYGPGTGGVWPIGSDPAEVAAAAEQVLTPDTRPCIAHFSAGFSDPSDQYVYMFFDSRYVRLEPRDKATGSRGRLPKVSDGYPYQIADKWPGLTGPFDCAVTDKEDKISYLFNEGKVWSWDWTSNVVGELSGEAIENTQFAGLPAGISASASYRDMYIFFAGHNFYIYKKNLGIVNPAGHPSPFTGDVPEKLVTSAYNSFFNGFMYLSTSDRQDRYAVVKSRKLTRDGGEGANSLDQSKEALLPKWNDKYTTYSRDWIFAHEKKGFRYETC